VITECGFDYPPHITCIVIPEERDITGVIMLRKCFFRRCLFIKVGFIVRPDEYERWQADLSRSTPA
jgi:hypothetical protein